MAISTFSETYLHRFEDFLRKFLNNAVLVDIHSNLLSESMQYSLLNPGKRLRPLLVYVTGRAFNVPLEKLDAAAAAVELIHCYSLIHDDLPAMDNDDFRRGKASCHKAFNESIAILAGDALQTLAFQVLSDPLFNPISESSQIKMINTLALAAGSQGMVDGQALDMSATNANMTLEVLKNIHEKKTGALIIASVCLAGIAANANLAQMRALAGFAGALGLAFQIQDDILDVEGISTANLGKTLGKDTTQGKATFPALLGIENARTYACTLYQEALSILNEILPTEGVGAELADLAKILIYREH